MNLKIKNIPFFICIISFIILSLNISVAIYKKYILESNTFRLHVIANSNDVKDQIIKLKIAHKIENYIKTLNNNLNKEQLYDNINRNIDNIISISNNELKLNNVNYSTNIKLGKIYYNVKEDIYVKMNNGSYDSLQILLGKAEGENYWNLLFPNKDNIENLKGLQNILPGITDIYGKSDNDNYKNEEKIYKFKCLEIIKNFI